MHLIYSFLIPVRNVVVDNSSLQPISPNQTISDIKVIAPVTGLDSLNHKIVLLIIQMELV